MSGDETSKLPRCKAGGKHKWIKGPTRDDGFDKFRDDECERCYCERFVVTTVTGRTMIRYKEADHAE